MLTFALALLALSLPSSSQDPATASQQVFEVVILEHAVAAEAMAVLQAAAPAGVQVVADPRTNSLLLQADSRHMARIKDLLVRIDQPLTQTPQRMFPLPSADMVVAVGEQGDSWSVMDMARDYGRLTNQHFIIDSETRGYLKSGLTGLGRSMVVPKADVQAVFEHVLERHDFVLLVLRQEEPRLLSIVSLQTGSRSNVRKSAMFVPAEDLEAWAPHASILITTVIHLPHTDVRQLSNSMRTMITDAYTQQMLPAGNTNSMVLTGFASNVAALARMLRIVDEATAMELVEPIFERLPLTYAQAAVAAPIVQELIDASTLRVNPQRGGGPVAPLWHVATRVVADERTNALLVLAMPSAMVRIHRLVKLIDVEQK